MHRCFAPCPRGLETVLAEELLRLGAQEPAPADGGVAFAADTATLYRANLASRIASRILRRVGEGPGGTEDEIYAAARSLPWPELFDVRRSIRVAVSAIRAPFRSLDFVTLRVKDAVCDAFRASTGARPDVDTRQPDVRIHAFVANRRATFYLDTSGEPLFRRGLRQGEVRAPLRENLAAGILALAGWSPGTPLFDPMCGGGTFVVEAAMIALGIAPGAGRGFGFERLTGHDAPLWREVREQVESARRPAGDAGPTIFASDGDARAVSATRRTLEHAGLLDAVRVDRRDVLDATPPAPGGILLANPPYGVRLGDREALAAFYPRLGDALKTRFAGWTCHLLSADPQLPKRIGLRASRRTPLYNGALECRLYEYRMVAGSLRERRPA